jgi:hypothetical protein
VQTIARLSEMLHLLSKTVGEITKDGGYAPALREMAALRVPESLDDDAAAAQLSSAVLAEVAREVAEKELAGLRSEKALTRRFRAPQTLAVLRAAREVVQDVANFLPASEELSRSVGEQRALLDAGIAEVEPMAAAGQQACYEEEDEDYV